MFSMLRRIAYRTSHQMTAKLIHSGSPLPEFANLLSSLRCITPEAFKNFHDILIAFEQNTSLGADQQLTEKEKHANCIIMREKRREYQKGIMEPEKFAPGYHLFDMLRFIRKSKLFHMLSLMPKGGVLHAHDTALCSTDYVINLTYRENLWICTRNDGCEAVAFRFSKHKPKALPEGGDCCWEPMWKFRDRNGCESVTKYLYRRFSMFPFSSFKSNNEAWQHFMGIFMLLDGLLLYAPVWRDYFYNALKEFSEDGVQYLELRSLLPLLYDDDGNNMHITDTVRIYKCTLDAFKKEHPDFIDAKLIYAPLRSVTNEIMEEFIQNAILLKEKFPDFMVGFDLVGQEELGRPLIDFLPQLLKVPRSIEFYFHAGETKWFGSDIDENLISAVLLGTKRIGHGYAITKHPMIMNLIKCLNIAVEVCPISNQVLQLGSDYLNHPASVLMASNVPVVISSDDPSFWRAAPLSHDFYMAFLGIASQTADLKLLKCLAKNSIKYSAMTDDEKANAMEKWKRLWNIYIEELCECDDPEASEDQITKWYGEKSNK